MQSDIEQLADVVVETMKDAMDPLTARLAALEEVAAVVPTLLARIAYLEGQPVSWKHYQDDVFHPAVKMLSARMEKVEARTMTPGPQGEKGLDGLVGPIGPVGPQGEKGERGEQGELGSEGRPGESITGPVGPQGQKGDPGDRGEKGDVGLLGPAGESIVGPAGLQGEKGDPGLQGERGLSGDRGEKGETGIAGRDGLPGVQGPAGEKGLNGADGLHGKDGAPGTNGRDGTLENLKMQFDGERTVTFCFKDGTPIEGGTIAFPTVLYRGVYVAGKAYEKNDSVTFGGNLWIAHEPTTTKPAEGKSWQLAVRAGRDGRQGKQGPGGDRGPKGDAGAPGRLY